MAKATGYRSSSVRTDEAVMVMDPDEASTSTSIEDRTEDFCENPTRDTLTEGIVALLRPTIVTLENSIRNTKSSQLELRSHVEGLASELSVVIQNQECPVDLDSYIKKLLDARRRITVINSVLQNAQERLNRLHQLSTKK